jgi:hypothetical protein
MINILMTKHHVLHFLALLSHDFKQINLNTLKYYLIHLIYAQI